MNSFEKFSINENGVNKQYSILSTFNINGKDNQYMVYTDYSINENKKMNIKVSKYIIKDKNIELSEITDEDEKKAIKEYLKEFHSHIQ